MNRIGLQLYSLNIKFLKAVWHRKFEATVFLALCLIYIVLRLMDALPTWSEKAWELIDTMLKLATLFIAFFLWINESYKHWVESLERRLYVIFRYDGKPVLRCDHAPLVDESDIRAFSQQIGAQMTGRRNLNFSINYRHRKYLVELGDGNAYRCHVCEFDLDSNTPFRKAPDSIGEEPNLAQLVDTNRCRYWRAHESDSWMEIADLPQLPRASELEY